MNELILAAKAVIEWWRHTDPSDLPIEQLIAAVERAEKPPAEFEEWFVKNYEGVFDWAIYDAIKLTWIAAQHVERERIKQIITYQFGDLVTDIDEVFAMIDEDSEHLPMRSEHLPAGDQVNPENPVHPVQT